MSQRRSNFRVERLEERRLLSHLAHPHPHLVAVHPVHHVAIRLDHNQRRRHAASMPAVLTPSTPSSESTPPATSATPATPAVSPPPAPAVTIYPPPTGTSSQSGSA
jgi:hypothetical protein